jgi:ABC-type polysaccharide/polyol phosphate export permease
MKNISIYQFIIVLFVGILLFSDFSKIIKKLQNLIKQNETYKALKKK